MAASEERCKVFQDATQGYISVEEVYVDNLIDTFFMQREKSVSQVGLRSIFSGASNDRFSHSLGVYNIGTKIFASFKKSVLSQKSNCKKVLEKYEVLFYIACFLHDIGHPAYSHTLEYLYNDDYIDLSFNGEAVALDEKVKRVVNRYGEIKKWLKKSVYLNNTFLNALKEKESDCDLGLDLHAAAHEIMGAYQILTVKDLQTAIHNILLYKKVITNKTSIKSKKFKGYLAFIARMITGCKYDLEIVSSYQKDFCEYSLRNCIIELLNGELDADNIDYLNRNAHFAGYASNNIDVYRLCAAFAAKYEGAQGKERFSLCIAKSALSSLDGILQARNFEPKWLYLHHKVVYFNEVLIKYLIKMSSVYLFEERRKEIESELLRHLIVDRIDILKLDKMYHTDAIDLYGKFIDKAEYYANTNETEYIKNHKTLLLEIDKLIDGPEKNKMGNIAIEDIVINQLANLRYDIFKFALFLLDEVKNSIVSRQIDKALSNIVVFQKVVQICNDMIVRFKYTFINDILSPMVKTVLYENGYPKYTFYKSTDSDVEKFFKDIRNSEPTVAWDSKKYIFRRNLFEDMEKELETRKYRQSLWKTYEEYKLFILDVIKDTGVNFELAHEMFSRLIESAHMSSCFIEFEDKCQTEEAVKDKNPREFEAIYVNCYDEYSEFKINDFREVFEFLGETMIIRFAKCKFKKYNRLIIKFDDKYVPYKDISTYSAPKNICFPYIFYREKVDKSNTTERGLNKKSQDLRSELAEKLRKYIIKKCCGESRNMDIEKINFLDGKVIRDSVHGDIFVPKKYLGIIESKAFQRLHRIRQLSTANFVFPEAVHTRFAHSLGTFHIMSKILDHFCAIFDKLKIPYKEYDKQIVLIAALLHDIGHGPFSHTFEEVSGNSYSHEEWTQRILKEDEEIQECLKNVFTEKSDKEITGKKIAYDVADCLAKNNVDDKTFSLKYVFSELVSSNLDADRMDYLMRDSLNTGEKFGIFDLQKLISSMTLTEYNGKLCVAVGVNALSVLEQFVMGRFNMYSMVYNHPYKLMTEKLFCNICEEIIEKADKLSSSFNTVEKKLGEDLKDLSMYKLIKNSDRIKVGEYLDTDEYVITHEITLALKKLEKHFQDGIYNELSNSFLYRKGYQRKHILSDNIAEYDNFRNHIEKEYSDFQKLKHSVMVVKKMFNAYERKNDKEILIIFENGEVKPFSEVSKFKNEFNDKIDADNKLWNTHYVALYLNKEMLISELRKMGKNEKIADNLEKLIDSYDLNEHTEIENKYRCKTAEKLDAIKKEVEKVYNAPEETFLEDYSLEDRLKEKVQKDVYFDTADYLLAQNGYSLRCRERDGKYTFTVKKPGAVGESKDESQFIRLEFETSSPDGKLTSVFGFLDNNNLKNELKNIDSKFDDYSCLKEVVRIENTRNTFTVKRVDVPEFKCEVALDDVEYIDCENKDNKRHDYQIEMELKSNYIYRINLNDFAVKLCNKFNISQKDKCSLSKYMQALSELEKYKK